MRVQLINFQFSPLDALSRWPVEVPLAALLSQSAAGNDDARTAHAADSSQSVAADRWSRWSILAPINPGAVRTLDAASLTATTPTSARRQTVENAIRAALDPCDLADPADLATSPAHLATDAPFPPAPPYRFIGLAYELGRVLEPSADPHLHTRPADAEREAPARFTPNLPLLFSIDCHAALVHDRLSNRWWRIDGGGDTDRSRRLDTLISSLTETSNTLRPRCTLSVPHSSIGQSRYTSVVEQALELIRAGDVFQVNLSHELRATLHGRPRAFFIDLCRAARPWFGAYLELPPPWSTIASISPELFLSFDARTRSVITRPIKGTRAKPATPAISTAAAIASKPLADELRHSAKDSAELNMIIDLLRNDLGRVCDFGSVRVDEARGIESHAVLHAVATVSGRLRADRTLADLMLATFPGGSITGAPKVRAMQIIESLETSPRGIYCGCLGLLTADGSLTSSIAIRTATITPDAPHTHPPDTPQRHVVSFPVGAGIVADSVPIEEWRETLTKASALMECVSPVPQAELKPHEPALLHARAVDQAQYHQPPPPHP